MSANESEFLLDVHNDVATPPSARDEFHISDESSDDSVLIWKMRCGLEALVVGDSLVPAIDFYHPNWWWKATCKACKATCGEE